LLLGLTPLHLIALIALLLLRALTLTGDFLLALVLALTLLFSRALFRLLALVLLATLVSWRTYLIESPNPVASCGFAQNIDIAWTTFVRVGTYCPTATETAVAPNPLQVDGRPLARSVDVDPSSERRQVRPRSETGNADRPLPFA
jgi:hypothetical protein